jgi:CHAT domain-containing protein
MGVIRRVMNIASFDDRDDSNENLFHVEARKLLSNPAQVEVRASLSTLRRRPSPPLRDVDRPRAVWSNTREATPVSVDSMLRPRIDEVKSQMKTEEHAGVMRLRALLAALVVALVSLCAPVGAAYAAANPADIARTLYVSYAEGDADGFKRLWAEGVAPVHLGDLVNEQRVKCITLVMFRADEPRIDADRAEVPVVAALWKTSRINGLVTVWVEHATIGMKREQGQWRIDRWLLKEDQLVERIAATKSVDEARALVRDSDELLDASFYRALRRQSSNLLNHRQYEEYGRLTDALREYAAFTADDGALSTACVLESAVERMGPKPDAAKALASARDAVALADQVGDPDVLASGLLNLAKSYQWRDGNSTSAAPLFERVISLHSRLEDEGLVVRAAFQAAQVQTEHGDYRACFPYIRLADEIATRTNSAIGLYQVEALLGDIYTTEGDFELAIPHLIRARDFAGKVHFDAGYLTELETLARCYLRLGRKQEFRTASDEVLTSSTGTLVGIAAEALNDVALDDLQHGDLEHAATAAEDALSRAGQQPEDAIMARSLETLARVRLAQKRYDDTIHAAERAIVLREKQQTVALFTPWLLEAKAHVALGDRPATYAALRSAVHYGEQERAGLAGSDRQLELFFEPAAAAYVMLVDLLIEDRRYEEAFLVAEKAKARALLDVLGSERSSAEKDMTATELAEEQRLEQKLVEANRSAATNPTDAAEVAKARLDLESFRADVDTRYPRLHGARGAGDLSSISSLAPLLSGGKAALVEFVVSAHHVHLFIVQAGNPPRLTVRTVPIEQPELERLIDQFSKQLASRNAAYRPAAERLYNLLLEPAVDVAGTATLFSIVPDDGLWRVPFETLVDGRGKFAIETRAFHYAPSAAVLLGERSRRMANVHAATGHVFLGFGNPRLAVAALQSDHTERGINFAPIPEAEEEVRAIGSLFGAGASTVYVGAEALESRSKAEAPDYEIVHFATHGVIDDANPMYSHLLLARREGDREDGALEAREMMKMHLTADLVVLSACDTARGGLHAGEGLIGMTWALRGRLPLGGSKRMARRLGHDRGAHGDLLPPLASRPRRRPPLRQSGGSAGSPPGPVARRALPASVLLVAVRADWRGGVGNT